MDYFMNVKARIPYYADSTGYDDNKTNLNFFIQTNKGLFSNGINMYWGIKEVLDEVSDLFEDHPDLLKEFTYFGSIPMYFIKY